MPIYNYMTYAQVRTEIANRLYDVNKVFWTDAEIGAYFFEALRTWNALTGYWRADFTFNASLGTTWYDLTNLTQLPNTLRPYTLTDVNIYTQMQYHLLEPASGVNPLNPSSSSMFTVDDYLGAVGRRRDEILSTTSCTVTQQLIAAAATRNQLGDLTIDIRRVAYLPTAGAQASIVWPDDSWAEQSYNRNYLTNPPGTPLAYMRTTQPPITFDVDCVPGFGGAFDVLTINAGPALSASTPSTLFIPDDWTDVLKWGALADLLSKESNAKDVTRSQYCEQRYRMGMQLLNAAPALIALRNGNTAMQIDSVWGADLYNTSWQAAAPGPPSSFYYAGLNLFALNPPADSHGPYGFLATVVQNAPLPIADATPIQVGRDDLDVIIDYTQHLAAFKMGGEEFTRTIPLFQRFLSQVSLYGLKLQEIGKYTAIINDLASREQDMNPVMHPDNKQRGGQAE